MDSQKNMLLKSHCYQIMKTQINKNKVNKKNQNNSQMKSQC